jgi:signal transduction histidine kinase
MTDERLAAYRQATAAMRHGQFDIDLPIGPVDEVGQLGIELGQLAATLEQRFRQFMLLLRVTERINSGILLDEVLDYVYSSFRGPIPYDRIGCALIEDGNSLRAAWARTDYPDLKIYKGYNLPLGATSLGQLLDARSPRIINDLEEYARTHPASESTVRMLEEGIRSSLTCPLVADGKAVGFLFFSSRRRNTYRDLHTQVFQQIAGHLAHIIEKARLYEQLVRLNAERNRFLGMAAHDLRSPLSGINGLLHLMRDDPSLSEENRKMVDLMIGACEGMVPLLDDLLDLSAIEAGTIKLSFAPVSVRPFFEKVVAFNASLARAKGTEIKLECAPAVSDTVCWDPQRVAQVITNLVSNAVKYSPPHSVVRVEVAPAPGGRLMVRVVDQGPGIAPEEQAALFHPYSRTSARPTGGEKSTGLGLAIAQRVVTAHGGEIGLERKVGSGSVFWFTLPVAMA